MPNRKHNAKPGPPPNLDASIAERLREARLACGWSLADLAQASTVSKAMIGKIERGEASPTASLLGRLAGALGMTLSQFLSEAESRPGAVVRREAQPVWLDPATRYVRRQVLPPGTLGVELIEIELPAGASVPFPASFFAQAKRGLWVLDGMLTFVEGAVRHRLAKGDCFVPGTPQPCTFSNEGKSACRYLIALAVA